jgi:hypothetical protein
MNLSKLRKWLRFLHRDIGYFVVGITLVYAISGVFLSHKNTFSATITKSVTTKLPQGLNLAEFLDHWDKNEQLKINHSILKKESILFFIEGGKGYYYKNSGEASYETYKKRPFVQFVNQLHNNQKKGWTYIADSYAFSLLFLTISGLFIVVGKNGFLKRGIWLMILGIVLVVVFTWVD